MAVNPSWHSLSREHLTDPTPMNHEIKGIARTGRVQSWIDSPGSRLPVSCTVFVVEDSMEGPEGIEASWRFTSYALRNAAGCSIHLSKLRPAGTDNGNGLVASGPVSFAKIYSSLNEVLRRGGIFKNGAVTLHLDATHPDALEFVTASRSALPWVKRCLDVDEAFLYACSTDRRLIDAVLSAVKKGDLWLQKIKYDDAGNRIYGNVCLEVYLPHRGTCLLQHVNLGALTGKEIPDAFVDGMKNLIDLHAKTGVGGEYLPPEKDRQVGLGILGLANLLAKEGVTYAQFADALEYTSEPDDKSTELVFWLNMGICMAAHHARDRKFDRAFAIAPTASCSYNHKDALGFTTCPEIAPPISRVVDRDSGTFGVQTIDYGDVETAEEVGWNTYKRVADGIVRLFERTGLFHGYSFNSWSDKVIYDRQFLAEWLQSPQTSLYYSLQVSPDTQAKDDALAALSPEDASWFTFEGLDQDDLNGEEITGGFCTGPDGGCSE